MIRSRVWTVAIAIIVLSAGMGYSAESQTAAAQQQTTSTKAALFKEAGNTTCPISGKAVGSMQKGAHVDYKGYRVGLCCSGCASIFMKHPDANLAKALKKAK